MKTVTPKPSANQTQADVFRPLPSFSQLPKIGDERFDRAMQVVALHEGLFSNDPDDAGGATAYGWSLRSVKKIGDLDGDGFAEFDLDFDGDVDEDDIRALIDQPEKAVQMYKTLYWDKYRYDLLPEDVAIKTFDLSVNMGATQAHKILQRSVRATGQDRLTEDGIIGVLTRQAVSNQDPLHIVIAQRAHARGFYDLLISKNHRLRKFRGGWHNRAYF